MRLIDKSEAIDKHTKVGSHKMAIPNDAGIKPTNFPHDTLASPNFSGYNGISPHPPVGSLVFDRVFGIPRGPGVQGKHPINEESTLNRSQHCTQIFVSVFLVV